MFRELGDGTKHSQYGGSAMLDIRWEDRCLQLGQGGRWTSAMVQRLEKQRDVLYEEKACGPEDMYWVYCAVSRQEDIELLQQYGLRYDVIVLGSGMVGREYVKTVGHYQPTKEEIGIPYPEI